MRKIILIYCLVNLFVVPAISINAQTKQVLPEIIEPTPPSDIKLDDEQQNQQERTNRFDFKGVIREFDGTKLVFHKKIFFTSDTTKYFGEGNEEVLSKYDFRVGDMVGCVLDAKGKLIEMWKIPPQ
ncbi:MAG: hypothetical protein HQK72_17600 [Desulfamplus sp.]|nr:hypothetical protein [Desulfamplus sp.]